jgi:hypothetical protein
LIDMMYLILVPPVHCGIRRVSQTASDAAGGISIRTSRISPSRKLARCIRNGEPPSASGDGNVGTDKLSEARAVPHRNMITGMNPIAVSSSRVAAAPSNGSASVV